MIGNIIPVAKASTIKEGIMISPANNFVIPSSKSLYSFSTVVMLSDVQPNKNGHEFKITMINPNRDKTTLVFKANVPDENFVFGTGKTNSFTILMTNLNINGTGVYTFNTTVDDQTLNSFEARFEVKAEDE